MTVTFVTAFLNMKEERPSCKNIETYLNLFQNLIDSNIQLHVYLSPDYYGLFKDKFSSEKVVIESIRLEDLRAYKELSTIQISLPKIRNGDKDTYNFLTLMNSKTEFMKKSIDKNVFRSTHFAWIDFGIFHIIQNTQKVKDILHRIHKKSLVSKFCIFPGIFPKHSYVDFSNVNWRFCGGFFLGDTESILQFDKLYEKYFLNIIKQYNTLTWETNIWSWFEQFLNWHPTVYQIKRFDDSFFEYIPFDKIEKLE